MNPYDTFETQQLSAPERDRLKNVWQLLSYRFNTLGLEFYERQLVAQVVLGCYTGIPAGSILVSQREVLNKLLEKLAKRGV